MSFLNRFKRKATEGEAPELPGNGRGPKDDPAVKIAAATVAAGYNPDFKLPPRKERALGSEPVLAGPPVPKYELILELGDFLPRIPADLLKAGTHDAHMALHFDTADLADRIARGQTTIPLQHLYKRAPSIFHSQVLDSDNEDIRFPWQKVMKLLADSKAGAQSSALTVPAAESLSEKVRSRKATRNIEVTPPEAAPAPSSKTAPPMEDAPSKTALAQPELKLVVAEPEKATPPPEAPPENVAEPTPAEPPAPEDEEGISREDLLRARDAARLAVARVKGEAERQLAAVGLERKALAEERDKVAAELERSRKEVQDKNEQVEFEKSVAVKSSENLAKLQQDREALQRELASREKEREASTAELQKVRELEKKLAEVVGERDNFAQQQAYLSKQIADFQKRGKVGLSMSGEGSGQAPANAPAANGPERSNLEYKRQIDELQRRIMVLESGRRESAQELGRERETRIKIERSLGAADRLRQETAVKLEEAHTALRREYEATAKKRDGEVTRMLKESQDQLDAANAARTKLAAELEETKARLSENAEATTPDAPVENAWEARAVAQLEADIDSYRARIKTLLQEREGGAGDKEKQIVELEARLQELTRKSEEQEARLKAPPKKGSGKNDDGNEALHAQLTAAHAEQERLAGQVRALGEKLAHAEKAQARAAKLESEREAQAMELAQAKSALTQTASDYQRQFIEVQEQHAAILRERDETLHTLGQQSSPTDETREDAAALRTKVDQLSQEQDRTKAEAEAALERLRIENQKLIGAAQSSSKEGAAELRAEITRLKQALEAAETRGDLTLTNLRAENQKLTFERETSAKEAEKLARELDAQNTAHGTACEHFEQERTRLQQEHESAAATLQTKIEALTRSLAEVATQREKLDAEKIGLEGELAQARATHEVAFGKSTSVKTELQKALDEATERRVQVEEKLAALTAELATAHREREHLLTASHAERDALQENREALVAELADAKSTREKDFAELQHDRDQLRAEAKATLQKAEQHFATLAAERDNARQECSALSQRLVVAEARSEEVAQQAAALAKERTTVSQDEEKLTARLEHELSRLKKERDSIAQQRDTLRARLTRLVEEQRDLLEEISGVPSEIHVSPSEVKAPKSREPKHSPVIDLLETEIVPGHAETESGLKVPRIRPVAIPPPQVRVL